MYLALVCISVFVGLTCVVLFGDSPALRSSRIAGARRALLLSLVVVSGWYTEIDRKLGGAVSWGAGWCVPLFYLGVISFCLYLFFSETYAVLLPLAITGSIAHSVFIFASVLAVYASTLAVIFSDPGILSGPDSIRHAIDTSPYNELIFFRSDCSTCKQQKPARSKHCSTCGHCVMVFDHHCVWLNNCIGHRNYRWFVAYMAANINFLFYGAYLTTVALRQGKAAHPTLGWWALIASTTHANKITGIFVILCSIFGLITSLFGALHVRYLYLGVTTNEADKWSTIEYLIGLGLLYKVLPDGPYVEKAESNRRAVYISLHDDRILFTGETLPPHQKIESIERDIRNIYDRGFVENCKDRVLI